MTFFNKKTEVMQIEMTPYGRYLYSIGKFMPHSYEFVDDDVMYKMSGSTETQESAHSRILSETPKPKINRAFQDEAAQAISPPIISDMRIMTRKMNQRQSSLYSLGRSAYSGSNIPLMQTTMLQGAITGSQMTYTVRPRAGRHGDGGEVLIPQVDVDLNFKAVLRDTLDIPDDYDGESVQSVTFDDGTYVDIRYIEPIIHLKEFNSFYEKENFEIEVFKITGVAGDETLTPLKMDKKISAIVNGLLVDNTTSSSPSFGGTYAEDGQTDEFVNHFFDVQVDDEIPPEELCKAVDKLAINSQFLDEELICPDQRTDRFDIYSTRVSPDDLEDCD